MSIMVKSGLLVLALKKERKVIIRKKFQQALGRHYTLSYRIEVTIFAKFWW